LNFDFWLLKTVFTFIPTIIELGLVCVLLAQKVSAVIAGIVFVTFVAYVWWTIDITQAAASSRKEVCKKIFL
jgi:ABC transporter ATM